MSKTQRFLEPMPMERLPVFLETYCESCGCTLMLGLRTAEDWPETCPCGASLDPPPNGLAEWIEKNQTVFPGGYLHRCTRKDRIQLIRQYPDRYKVFLLEDFDNYRVYGEDAVILTELLKEKCFHTKRGPSYAYPKSRHDSITTLLEKHEIPYLAVHPDMEEEYIPDGLLDAHGAE